MRLQLWRTFSPLTEYNLQSFYFQHWRLREHLTQGVVGICSGFSRQRCGELGDQSKGLRLPQLQPQTRLSESLCRRLPLWNVAGSASIISRPGILPGVPLTKWHSPGRKRLLFGGVLSVRLKMMLQKTKKCNNWVIKIHSIIICHISHVYSGVGWTFSVQLINNKTARDQYLSFSSLTEREVIDH